MMTFLKKITLSILALVMLLGISPFFAKADSDQDLRNFLETLIKIGVIAPEKADLARTVLNTALSGSSTRINRDLTTGSTGDDVKLLQKVLNTNPSTVVALSGPGSSGNETTTFGPATKAAVIKFQNLYNFSPTGIVDAVTRAKVNAILSIITNANVPEAQRPSVDLKVNGQDDNVKIGYGSTVTIMWTSTNVTSCVSGANKVKPVSGTESVTNVTTAGEFTMTCVGPKGIVSDTVTATMANRSQVNRPTNMVTLSSNPASTTDFIPATVVRIVSGPSVATTTTTATTTASTTLNASDVVGYGPVNYWMDIDPASLALQLKMAGLTSTYVEIFGMGERKYTDNPTVVYPKLKAYVEVMRKYGIYTMIELVNGKMRDEDGQPICGAFYSNAWYTGTLDYIINNIGTDHVVLEPSTEWVSGCREKRQGFIDIFIPKWTGLKTFYVGNGSILPPSPDWLKEYHPGSFTDYGSDGQVLVTDGGDLLKAIGKDGDGTAFADTAKLKAYVCHVLDGGKKGFIYYAFGNHAIDSDAISAIGEVAMQKGNADCAAYDAAIAGGEPIGFGGQVMSISECKNKGGGGEKLYQVVIKSCTPGDQIGTSKEGELLYGTGYITFRENNPPLPSIGSSVLGGEVPDESGRCEVDATTTQPVGYATDVRWIGDASGPLGTGPSCIKDPTATEPPPDSYSGSKPKIVENGFGLW